MYPHALISVFALSWIASGSPPAEAAGAVQDGISLEHQGRFGEAESRLRLALRDEEASGTSTVLKAITLYYLAQVNEDLGRIDEAARLCGQAVSILRQTSAPDDPRVQTIQIELARLYAAFGQLETAEKLLKRVLIQPSPQIDGGLQHAAALTALAAVDVHRRRFKDAERLDRQAISLLERRNEPHQPDLFTATSLLVIILDATRRAREALSYAERAAEILEHLETVEPINTIEIRAQVAELYAKTGRSTDAESFSQQALTDVERVYGANHVYTAWILLARAEVLRRIGRKQEAKTAKQRGQIILSQSGQLKRLAETVPFSTLIPLH